jgi:hypothetical protein
MEWFYLGHAMWLLVVGELRVLFDPLIDGRHHGGVFEIVPPRRVDLRALAPDFILVSHAHPDHFDVASLRALAEVDPDTVVFTADRLVETAARRLGFREVRVLEGLQRVELEGLQLFTTPSIPGEVEWGVVARAGGSTAWNLVDTAQQRPDNIPAILAAAAKELGDDALASGPDLALVRWQPLLEIARQVCDRTSFPFALYDDTLAQIASVGARTVVPASAGAHHAAPFASMNRVVYPVPLARALRDIEARAPGTRAFPSRVGASYRVAGRETSFDPEGGAALVEIDLASIDDRAFRPFDLAGVVDPNLSGEEEGALRAEAERWIGEALSPALARAFPQMRVRGPLRFVVEVVFPHATDAYTIVVGEGTEPALFRARDDDYDALNVVAGSFLVDVVRGKRHWGEPLLAGLLRSSLRAYEVTPRGLVPANVAPMFLYYALSYEESMRRWVEWQLTT